MNFNELKKAMIDANKKAKDCAAALGITESTYSRKMSGKTEFSRSEIWKLAEFLNLDAARIKVIFFS